VRVERRGESGSGERSGERRGVGVERGEEMEWREEGRVGVERGEWEWREERRVGVERGGESESGEKRGEWEWREEGKKREIGEERGRRGGRGK